MSTPAINTIIRMMEALPEDAQEQVVDLLREVITEMQDEAAWDESFKRTQGKLVSAAKRARKEIREGRSTPLDLSKL